MTTESVSSAVAKVDTGPTAIVKQYRQDFVDVLPTHLTDQVDSWVRKAQLSLKKGPRNANGRTELEIAASNNPQALILALRDAARLGLEPGTEQFYLTPRRNKNQTEILGIVGWQGYVELMFRAGAISTVIAEVVYSNDKFEYTPGVHERPVHTIDWDAEKRGDLRLAYAYAIMRDGATSKVVVYNQHDIKRVKASSQGADSQYSPWVKHEAAMWQKSVVRQLAKWVPTSAEKADVHAARVAVAETLMAPFPRGDEPIDVSTLGEMRDDDPDVYAAEIVDEAAAK